MIWSLYGSHHYRNTITKGSYWKHLSGKSRRNNMHDYQALHLSLISVNFFQQLPFSSVDMSQHTLMLTRAKAQTIKFFADQLWRTNAVSATELDINAFILETESAQKSLKNFRKPEELEMCINLGTSLQTSRNVTISPWTLTSLL